MIAAPAVFAPLLAEGIDSLMPVLVLVFFVISVLRALRKAQQARQEHQASGDDTAEDERARQIRERLRRIAEERQRHAGTPPPLRTDGPAPRERSYEADDESERPMPAPPSLPGPLEPFGGPLKRILDELERKVTQPIPSAAPPRMPAPEPLAPAPATVAIADSEATAPMLPPMPALKPWSGSAFDQPALTNVPRRDVVRDLHDPESVRRAFILREVIGPPVGLR